MIDSIAASIKKLKNTEPYFVVYSTDKNKEGLVEEITFKPQNKYDPYTDPDLNLNDPIERFTADNFYESWNAYLNQYVLAQADVARSIRDDLMSQIRQIYMANCQAKKPRVTKTYKFLADFRVDSANLEKQELMVALLRYIKPYVGDKNRFNAGADCPHGINFFEILEKTREKYER